MMDEDSVLIDTIFKIFDTLISEKEMMKLR